MEQIVSSGIIDSYFEKLKSNLSVDVAIRGTEEAPVVVKKGTIVTEDIV